MIIQYGLQAMVEKDEDVIYYLTLYNENYKQPAIPNDVEDGIIKGMYKYQSTSNNKPSKVHLLGSGSILNEVVAASDILVEEWNVDVDVWSVTSYSELRKDGDEKKRWNILHPEEKPKIAYVTSCLSNEQGPVVAISDYVKLVAEQIAPFVPQNFTALGTDGFGRSEARTELRDFFEVSRYYIVLAVLNGLYMDGQIESSVIQSAIEKYQLDSEKPNQLTV